MGGNKRGKKEKAGGIIKEGGLRVCVTPHTAAKRKIQLTSSMPKKGCQNEMYLKRKHR